MLKIIHLTYQGENKRVLRFCISLIVSIAVFCAFQNSLYAATYYYEYDASNRLIAVYINDGSKQYKITHIYDSQGNLLSKKKTEVTAIIAPVETSLSNASYEMIANGVDPGATIVRFKTWTSQNPAPVWHEGKKIAKGVWKTIIPFNQHASGVGQYTTQVFVGDALWGQSITLVKKTTSVRIPLEISLAEGGYDVYVDGVGDKVTSVKFPTWTSVNGQDDLVWSEGRKISEGTWKVTIPFSEHNYEKGSYITHIYTYDAAGNGVGIAGHGVEVKEGVKAPVETSYSNASYEIIAYGVDPGATSVKFPTWSGQDAAAIWYEGIKTQTGIWKVTIPFNKHIGSGQFTTHIYVGNTLWKVSSTLVKQTTSVRAPLEISLAQGGYEVYVDGVGDKVTKVLFPTWTSVNGQDDLVWNEGRKISGGTWSVWIPFSEHNYEKGSYITHIYSYDAAGNGVGIGGHGVEVKEGVKAPVETSYSNASYEIIAYGVDPGVTSVKFPTWSGQDAAAIWHEGTKIQTGVWKVTIPFNKHIGSGQYTTHIYVGNTFWKASVTLVKQTTSVQIPSEISFTQGGYDVYVNGVGDQVTKVLFPTWTNQNGQDDIIWSAGQKISQGTWKVRIPFSEHNNEKGTYLTHIYTYDASGNSVAIAGYGVEVK